MVNSKTNSDELLIIYNELDNYMRRFLNEKPNTPNTYLIKQMERKNRVFAKFKDDLYAFSNLRNAIVHNPDIKYADPIAEPHEYVVKKYRNIINLVLNPPVALDSIAIPYDRIYTTTLNSKAFDVTNEMVRNAYTHVPVVEENKLIGVFSESTVVSYLSKNRGSVLLDEPLVSEFVEYIDIKRNESEYYEFVKKDILVIDIEDMFHRGFKDNKRLAVVFITENGRLDEKLLGLVTVWDLAVYQKE